MVTAERIPRLGVPPAGAFDLRPGPGGRAWGFDRADDRDRVIRLLGARRPYLLAGVRRAPTGAVSTCMSTTPAWTQ
eukprot:8366547-Alexandrium_andersonii.AAC.1